MSKPPLGHASPYNRRLDYRALARIPGNLTSPKLPGKSLIAAVLDRQLMGWSDRGGASKHFGDRWSDQCADQLVMRIGGPMPVPDGPSYLLRQVVRLDGNPAIAIQAGNHKLANPDFVLVGETDEGEQLLQSVDAKFAVDTVKPVQVEPDSLAALLAVENGLVRDAIEQATGGPIELDAKLAPGLFLIPSGTFNDYFGQFVTGGPHPRVAREALVELAPDCENLFAGLGGAPLMPVLAKLDDLGVDLRHDLLATMYYFRLACACGWMWVRQHTPLLSNDPPPVVDPPVLLDETIRRANRSDTAFHVVTNWHRDNATLDDAREAIKQASRLPLRMGELRSFIEASNVGDEVTAKQLRILRGAIESRYRTRLIAEVGVIPADTTTPVHELQRTIAAAKRQLRQDLLAETPDLVRELFAEPINPAVSAVSTTPPD